jgi:Flp pilus assembly protein TadG
MIAVSTRRRKQRGNTILESAMCFLPMMAMFFGIIDVCFALSIQSLFSQAVRAGARWAITYSGTYNGTQCGQVQSDGTLGSGSQAACITKVVQDNAVGFLAGAKSNYVVVKYYIPNNLSTPIDTCNAGTCTLAASPVLPNYTYSVTTVSGNTTGTTTVTINYPNQPGNVIEVSIPAYPLLWMVPITGYGGFGTTGYTAGSSVTDTYSGKTGSGLTLGAYADDVLGGLTVGTSIPPAP